jgi:hypothetical protein
LPRSSVGCRASPCACRPCRSCCRRSHLARGSMRSGGGTSSWPAGDIVTSPHYFVGSRHVARLWQRIAVASPRIIVKLPRVTVVLRTVAPRLPMIRLSFRKIPPGCGPSREARRLLHSSRGLVQVCGGRFSWIASRRGQMRAARGQAAAVASRLPRVSMALPRLTLPSPRIAVNSRRVGLNDATSSLCGGRCALENGCGNKELTDELGTMNEGSRLH